MARLVLIGALAPLLALGAPARADWRSPISGAKPILPTGFTPQHYVIGSLTITPAPPALPRAPIMPGGDKTGGFAAGGWSLPLLDRTPSAAEKAADLAPELQDAILRIEPIYDPTRLEGPDEPVAMAITAGTASMDNVFADRWRRDDLDPNVDIKTTALALTWARTGERRCDAYTRARPHPIGEPALTALDADDCRALLAQAAKGFDDDAQSPIVVAVLDVPVFAAPLPGSRLSSADFWAARRARVAAIQARLRRRWQAGAPASQQVGMR
jgi:hypothetical protein